jgi:hypothetical protein
MIVETKCCGRYQDFKLSQVKSRHGLGMCLPPERNHSVLIRFQDYVDQLNREIQEIWALQVEENDVLRWFLVATPESSDDEYSDWGDDLDQLPSMEDFAN